MKHSPNSLVLIIELEPMTRLGLAISLATGTSWRVCGSAGSHAEARELCTRWRPALVVMDCLAPGGLALLKEMPRWSPGAAVVCFTRAVDALSVQRVLQAGARGYVTREDAPEALHEALRVAQAGGRATSPRVAGLLLETLAQGGVEVRNTKVALLSDRELEVFRMLGSGLGTRSVAERLHLSVKTIETHRERIKGKLQVESATELQRRAILFHNEEGRTEGPRGMP